MQRNRIILSFGCHANSELQIICDLASRPGGAAARWAPGARYSNTRDCSLYCLSVDCTSIGYVYRTRSVQPSTGQPQPRTGKCNCLLSVILTEQSQRAWKVHMSGAPQEASRMVTLTGECVLRRDTSPARVAAWDAQSALQVRVRCLQASCAWGARIR